MPGISEIFENTVSDHLADILDLKQLFLCGGCDRVYIPEMTCDLLCRGLSDITDAKGEQHVVKRHFL